jgi:hypothetical protein
VNRQFLDASGPALGVELQRLVVEVAHDCLRSVVGILFEELIQFLLGNWNHAAMF